MCNRGGSGVSVLQSACCRYGARPCHRPLACAGPALGVLAHPLRVIFNRLSRAFGPQHWWPATTPFEMMVGAILTQAANWQNVERAIGELKRTRTLTPHSMVATSRRRVERLIRSAGYFRQKAKRLRVFSRWYLSRYNGRPARMFGTPWPALRRELLSLHGIGPETADAILLYAGGQPVFVVDAYTILVLRRHHLIEADATYEEVQQLAMHQWPRRPKVYNEFHALVVAVGKRFCHRRDPDCTHCPLGDLPHTIEVTVNGRR